MLHATLTGAHGEMTVKMNGGWEDRCPIWIDAHPEDEREVRDWLKHGATGMFGHLVGDDKMAQPCDVHSALTNPGDPTAKGWKPKIVKADIRTVKSGIPDGAVT